MGVYQRAVLPLLHRLDPETTHHLTMSLLALVQVAPLGCELVSRLFSLQDSRLAFTWRGLTFRNPVGIAAGVDKNGRAPRIMHGLGMGFIEVGTVTPRPQPGNPRPRIFRVPKQEALVNRMGFPNDGAERLAGNLARLRLPGAPLGVNIGKNASTPLAEAADDYLACLEALHRHADYFVVNVSSPNTEGLTSLQARSALGALTQALLNKRRELARRDGTSLKPLLIKISPDLSPRALDEVVEVCAENEVDGVIAVNTSIDPALRSSATARLPGGLSGRPLRQRAVDTVAYLRRRAPENLFIVGVGGVFDADDAWSLLRAGANAVQMYSGLVYRGPGAVRAINRGLLARLDAAGLATITDAAGGTGG